MNRLGLLVFMLVGFGVVLAIGVAVYTNNQQPPLQQTLTEIMAVKCFEETVLVEGGPYDDQLDHCVDQMYNIYSRYEAEINYCQESVGYDRSRAFHSCLVNEGVRFRPTE